MEKTGVWGGYFELYCLSQALEVNFIIVMKDLNVIKIEHFPVDKVRTFYLGFSEDEENSIPEHYSSLRILDDTDPRPKDYGAEEIYPATQIPLESFRPILTNHELDLKKDKITTETVVITDRKKLSRKQKLDLEKKKSELDKISEMNESINSQNQSRDIALKFKPFDKCLQEVMDSRLKIILEGLH